MMKRENKMSRKEPNPPPPESAVKPPPSPAPPLKRHTGKLVMAISVKDMGLIPEAYCDGAIMILDALEDSLGEYKEKLPDWLSAARDKVKAARKKAKILKSIL